MSGDELVSFELQDRLAIITLNDARTLNALGGALLDGLAVAIERARCEPSARALLIRGRGRAFSARADLMEIRRRMDGDAGESVADYIARLMTSGGNPIVAALRRLPMPSICGVNGVAAGGGVGLALAADIVIAARSAYFYLPFTPSLNLVPDLGATWALAHKVGRARALGLALTGHKLSAEKAEQWGLIWKCVPDDVFETEALALARSLAEAPREATLALRNLVDRAAAAEFELHLAEEASAQRRLAATEAFREGVTAFIERRKPSFP